jgi:site-specific DNA-methyltransferase (adenine-specific)
MEIINKIHTGNAIELLKILNYESIDLTVTSPPYDNLRIYNNMVTSSKIYQDGYSFPFVEMARELFRVTKDGGVVVWVVNDQVIDGGESGNSFRQALKFQELGFTLYDTMIYLKNGASHPETGRYYQVFEYMFILSKGKPKTINLLKDKPNKWAGTSTFGTPTKRMKDGTLKKTKKYEVSEYGVRYNVWEVKTGKGYSTKDLDAHKHPAIFPESLAEDHILTWSNEGDIVLDPMSGSGTTLKMAKLNNRKYIGFDINSDYVELAKLRIDSVVPYTDINPNMKEEFIPIKRVNKPKTKSKKKGLIKNICNDYPINSIWSINKLRMAS